MLHQFPFSLTMLSKSLFVCFVLLEQIAMCDQPPPEVETIEVLQQPEHRQLLLLTKQCLQLEPSSRVNASGIVKHLYFVDASSLCSN